MKNSLLSCTFIALFALLAATAAEGQQSQEKTVIRVRGSDSMAGRIEALAKVFMKDNPHVNIIVSGGSLLAPDILKGDGCEIAMYAYKMTDDEKRNLRDAGVTPVERLVGYGGIVFIAHPSNTVEELTVEQMTKIFTGAFTSWDQVGGRQRPIRILTVKDRHPASLQFVQTDLLGSSITDKAEILSSFQSVALKVAATPDAIAFTRVRDVFESAIAEMVALKVLKIKSGPESPGVLPTRENIANKSYPVRRPFFIYTKADGGPDTKRFVEFIVSKGWGAQSLASSATR